MWYPCFPGHKDAKHWADLPQEAKEAIRAHWEWKEETYAVFMWEFQESEAGGPTGENK